MEWLIFGILRYLVCQLRDKQATQTTSCTLKTTQERNLCSQVIYIETILRMQVTSLLPWVPEVFFSRVRRGTSFCRPQADTCSAKGRTDTSGNRATWHPGYLSSHH